MYKFKTIDYRLSKQKYVFKLLSIDNDDEYKFVYIPYSEFPALVMLDHILATNPHKFSADLYNYFEIVARKELNRYGDKEILLLSNDTSNRDTYLNKLGILRKNTHQSLIIDSMKKGNLNNKKNSSVLSFEIVSDSPIEKDVVFDVLSVGRQERGAVLKFLTNLGRDNEFYTTLSCEINSIFKENRESILLDNRIDLDLVKDINITVELQGYGENYRKAASLKELAGTTLNKFKGVIKGGEVAYKDYLPTSMDIDSNMYRESILKEGNKIVDTMGQRVPYIDSEIVLGDNLFERGSSNQKGFLDTSYVLFNKYTNTGIEQLLVGEEKENLVDVVYSLDMDIVDINKATLNGFIENKGEIVKEVQLVEDVLSFRDVVKISTIIDDILGDTDRDITIIEDSLGDKDSIGEAILSTVFNGEGEEEKYSFIFNLRYFNRVYNKTGIVFTDSIADYDDVAIITPVAEFSFFEDRKAVVFTSNISDKEKIAVTMQTVLFSSLGCKEEGIILYSINGEIDEIRDADIEFIFTSSGTITRDSVIISSYFSNKEDDVIVHFSSYSDKERKILLTNDLKLDNVFSGKGLLLYESDFINEKQRNGVKESIFTLRFETSRDSHIGLDIYYGNIMDRLAAFIDSSASNREIEGKSVIESDCFTGIGTFREGKLEYSIEARKPRKKLLKSWLSEWEREGDKKLYKEACLRGIRSNKKSLMKITPDLYYRDKIRELALDTHTLEGEIKRKNKLIKDSEQIESKKDIISKLADSSLKQGLRDIKKPLLKFKLDGYDFGKDSVLEYNEYLDKFKNSVIEEQIDGQSLMYNYSDILKEGMDVEHWDVGYAIPEDYDPQDPFNPYYPWAEEKNKYSIVQEDEWMDKIGDWDIDKKNAVIKSEGGGGLLISEKPYDDFKFSFNTYVGYNPDCRTGFVFNYKDPLNYYKITLSSGNIPIELVQVIEGNERKLATPIAPFYMDEGSEHKIDVSYIEDKLIVYVDGRLQYALVLEDWRD